MTIIKDHKKHFIKRLTSRSPLLKCSTGAYREDLTELTKISLEIDKDIKQTTSIDVLNGLLSENPKRVEIFNAQKKNLAKCAKIKNESSDYFHTTGQNSFYLAYPFIAIPDSTNKYYLAPLFLWAVSCEVKANSIIFDRMRDEDKNVLEPQLNRILKVWLAHEKNVHLSWENSENLTWDTIEEEIKNLLSNWQKCDSDFDKTDVRAIPDKEFFKHLTRPKIISSAIIGYLPIKGQALLDDLDKLEELLKNGNSKVLDYFLKPIQSKSEQAANTPKEHDKWLVTDSDHSQEAVLWNTRKFDLTVLQGPPGTGKSQVIVNLIADALANQKRVLVVCQKRAALEVIKKRLETNGLGDLLQLVDDVQKDRLRIIKGIKDIQDDIFSVNTHNQSNRQIISDNLQSHEAFLDKVNKFLTDAPQGLTYGNLKARLYQLEQTGIDAYGEFSLFYQECQENKLLPEHLDNLRLLIQETNEFIKNYQECKYEKNPWSALQNSSIHIYELNALLKRLVSLAQFLENKNHYFYAQNLAWIAEHSWTSAYYPNFLSAEYHEVHKYFKQLCLDTQKLKTWLPENYVNNILISVRSGEIKHYSLLKNSSGYIQQVLFVQDKLKQFKIFDVLQKQHSNKILNWKEIIECLSLQAWFDNLSSQHPVSRFSFEQQKNNLEKVIEQKRNADIENILAKYQGRVSARNTLVGMGLLQIKKTVKSPKTSLRKLYTSGFKEVNKVYPILLTNPETVSSLLELKSDLYDLVIIDEASQMFMADALPILYRAKTAFISGDNKQMPPSDFFMSLVDNGDNDDDQENTEEDEEIANKNRLIPADGEYCLLEAAEYSVPKGNPNQTMLSVHYRSEFKELIDFSNHAFYEGKLIAASSNKKLADIIKSPIELIKLENAQAESSVNKQEALAVVERIKEIWNKNDDLSLGVITLNVKQKDAIDDLLFEQAQIDSHFAELLERERNKTKDGEDIGFFVRSVEHVQGDERDIIILSTVYDGVRRNFGAITKKEKGRKRLNVAITRAKLGMIIYSSLNIDAISNDNQRDTSENYWFWKYMCYARAISSNDKAMAESVLKSLNPKFQQSKTGGEPDSYFEEDVAEFLRTQGYYVDYQIGESGFRIDLGVKRNSEDRLYLCGIECDGRQYHSSWNARLNDIWRQKILENKGWKIIRIWSNDWFDNRKVTQEKLLADLKLSHS